MRVDSLPQPLSLPHSIRPCPFCAKLGSRVAAGAPGDTKPSPHDSDPVHWAQSELHFSPDVVQAAILRSTARRLILCCTRQFGKSTVTAIKALAIRLDPSRLSRPGRGANCPPVRRVAR